MNSSMCIITDSSGLELQATCTAIVLTYQIRKKKKSQKKKKKIP